MRKFVFLLVTVLVLFPTVLMAYEEKRVRVILADISTGGPLGYYDSFPDDENAVEAVRRWKNGVRVLNRDTFHRVNLPDIGWTIVRAIDGMEVILTSQDTVFSESRVRYILADIATGGPASYYASYPNDSDAVEAVRRHRSGVRVVNAGRFERVNLPNVGWTIVYEGTSQAIDSHDVVLSSDLD